MIKTLNQKIVYHNKWMTVREDQVEFPNGHPGIYGVVEKPDFALIVPLQDGMVHLVRQYRYPVQRTYWEFPQGSYEADPTIDPTLLARQELEEETGLVAGTMTKIGYLYEAYGYCNQGFHIFVATDFSQGEQRLEPTEQDLEVHRVSLAEFRAMVRNGDIRDAPTVSAYGLLAIQGYV